MGDDTVDEAGEIGGAVAAQLVRKLGITGELRPAILW
jgi:hypothetical protein